MRVLGILLLLSLAAGAADPVNPAAKYFTDTQLISQDGARLRFYSDLLKGKVVVVNNFFTTCKDSCPVMAGNLAAIQEHFRERMGKDLFLISLTVDPTNDTPARMKEYAVKMHARPGWFFLTGKKDDVDLVLLKLGQRVSQREDHADLFFIGNDRTGLWKKALGMASKEQLFSLVEQVLNDDGK